MARSRKKPADPGPGHNSTDRTEEDLAALTTHFALAIIADEKAAAMVKAQYDAARAKVTAHYKLISNELKVTRKDFEANVLTVFGMTEAEYLSAEKKRQRLHRLAGVQTGEQLDLEALINDTVDDAIAAEADGYRAGRRAEDPEMPDNFSPIFSGDWMRGYHKGQEVNGMQLAKAAEVLARPKPGEMVTAPEDAEEEDPADPDVIRRKANELKGSDWMDPTPAETAFAEDVAA